MHCEANIGPLMELMRREGVSVYRLSKVSGITDPALYSILKGRTYPSLQTLARIKCALEVILGRPVSLDELVEVRRG